MTNNAMTTKVGKMQINTPIMTTSGCSGSSSEIDHLSNSARILNALGAFVTKGVTLKPRVGNSEPRIVETRSGILNSIGLQNSGAAKFVKEELPKLLRYEKPIVVNISAGSVEEFGILAEFLCRLDVNKLISGLEINVSCPNIHEGGIAFGTNPRLVRKIVETVKSKVPARVTIITKLSPNVTDIVQVGQAAVDGGTDALSMINTLRGMAIDVDRQVPILGNVTGGLSGPAIKPVGIFMVHECFKKIPECAKRGVQIVGIGGITNWRDAVEYILAGASAVGVGTEWFVNPAVFQEIHSGIKSYLCKTGKVLSDMIGALRV